jgi:hypothetical protein
MKSQMQCASIRKRGSTERCTAKCLRGHTLCGRHARMKVPILWSYANAHKKDHVLRIQAHVRGWLVRLRFRMGGPGILCRKELVNDEDLVTYDEKDKVHPMDYFSFVENGKIWWFRFDTIYQWCAQNLVPTNPYTKTPLSADTRKRIRFIWNYKRRNRNILPQEPATIHERMRLRWNIICQLFEDYGFGLIKPESFYPLKRMDYVALFRMIRDDINILFKDTHIHWSKLMMYCAMGEERAHTPAFMCSCPYILMLILATPRDPYIVAFAVLSALYRC